MLDWLRLVLMAFYAPARGLREMRDRGALGQAALIALVSQVSYLLVTQWLSGEKSLVFGGPRAAAGLLFQSAISLLLIAGVLTPIIAFVGNLFERRGSFGLLLQQEYASLGATVLYALAIANLLTIPIAIFFNASGMQSAYIASSLESATQIRSWVKLTPEMEVQLQSALSDPRLVAASLFRTIKLSIFLITAVMAVRTVLRTSAVKAIVVTLISLIVALLIAPIWTLLFTPILASPFLLLMLFFLLRGYIGGVMQTQRARESFRQNMEAATLNPADASAHYNLGLIHQSRGELDAARERFERAIQIDEEEVDAHYQLGRIARQQKRLADAVRHFEQVVARNRIHSQHEIWREVGATYIEAEQYEDARDALEQFLESRPSDPEALYLMGRAHAGLGHQREATSSMQACIDAVKTAPAYKYRADKRWLNEAQQFIRSSQ
ncbi:MAG: tetratricopeptide repeat protein [Pyrinomonadaceae bacterium]